MSKRRTFTPEFKAQVVLEELVGIKDKAEICREYQLRLQVLFRWREEFLERAPEIFAPSRSRSTVTLRRLTSDILTSLFFCCATVTISN